MQLIAHVGSCRSAIRCRTMPGSGVGICGIALAPIRSNAEDFGLAKGSLLSLARTDVNKLSLSSFAIEFNSDRLAMKSAPGLNVGPVDCHRSAHQEQLWNRRSSQLVREPGGVNSSVARFENLAELCEKTSDPRI